MISKLTKTLLPITALGCVQGNAMTPKKQQKPNIIYIMCDDMGYGDLGCYGQKYILTPNIDRMAKEGMRFTQAYAGAPVSAPSSRVRSSEGYGWRQVEYFKWPSSLRMRASGESPATN